MADGEQHSEAERSLWWVGSLSRTSCEAILGAPRLQQGAFFVREGSTGLVLSVRASKDKVLHCRIFSSRTAESSQYWIAEDRKFATIAELIQSCYHNRGVLIDGSRWVELLDPLQHAEYIPPTSSTWTCCVCGCQNVPGATFCKSCSAEWTDSANAIDNKGGTAGGTDENGGKLVCPTCSKGFQSLASLVACIRRCHQGPKTTAHAAAIKLYCSNCSREFRGRAEFAEHVRLCARRENSSDVPLQFWTCAASSCLRVNPPYSQECESCGATFASLTSPWTCDYCKCLNDVQTSRCTACDWERAGTGSLNRAGRRVIIRGLMRDGSLRRPTDLRDHQGLEGARKQLDYISSSCRDLPFVNPDFPVSLKSIYKNGLYPQSGPIVAHHWRRGQDVIPSNVADACVSLSVVQGDGPLPTDILQGDLGNCWFLSALSLVASNRRLFDRVLLTREVSPVGVYQVRLAFEGEWKTVLLDDIFPCKEKGTLAFASGRKRQMWVPLVEKAAASLFGSYEALQEGSVSEGLRLLTGCPCETVQLRKIDFTCAEWHSQVWAHMVGSRRKGDLIGASSGLNCSGSGLVPSHAYTVVHTWSPRDGVRLICIHNPYGKCEWSGPWCDGSANWKDFRCNAPDGGRTTPGQSWLDFSSFCEHFSTIHICKVSHDWDSVRCCGSLPRNTSDSGTCFQLKPVQPTPLHLHLETFEVPHQPDSNNPVMRDLGIAVLQVRDGVHVQDSELILYTARRVQRSIYSEVYLDDPSCTYVVVPMSLNHLGLSKEKAQFKCDFHTSGPVLIESVKCPPELITAATVQQTISHGKLHLPFVDDRRERMRLFEFDSQFVVENRSRSKYFKVEIHVEEMSNFACTRLTHVIEDIVPPEHRQLVCALTPTRQNVLSTAKYRLNFTTLDSVGDKSDSFHIPKIGCCDMHCPYKLSQKGLGKIPTGQDPYSDWSGGGFGNKGAFGGAAPKSEADIDDLLRNFLRMG